MTTTAQTIWLTGLSAAGKTTLAYALAQALAARGVACEVLDGDELRKDLCRDLGFSREDRKENIRRVSRLCRQINDAGSVAIAALVSPYRADREMARRTIGDTRFIEVYVSTPLAICEQRDPKGLYEKARTGKLSHFTGVDDPYEAPLSPTVSCDTGELSTAESVAAIISLMMPAPAHLCASASRVPDDRSSLKK